jgi:hypothetical protein
MIKDNQHYLNHFHVVLDALIVAGSYALAWYLLIASRIFPAGHGVLPPQVYFRALIPVVPGYLFMYWLFHLYEPKRTRTKRIREKTGERTANLVLEINGNTKPCRGNKMNSYISVKLSTGQGRLKFKDLFDMIGAPSWIRGVIHNRLSTAHEISCAFFTPHSEFSRQEERQWILNHSGSLPVPCLRIE